MSGITRGALCMILAAAGFAGVVISVRELSVNLPTIEILFFRNLISAALLLPWLFGVGFAALRTSRMPMYFLRMLFSLGASVTWFYVIGAGEIALGDAVALQFTLPLFTILGAVLFLDESAGKARWLATFVGFVGAIVILRPGMIALSLSAFLALVSAAFYAGVNLTAKSLVRTEKPNLVVFHLNVLMLPITLIWALFDWTMPAWANLPWLILLGLSNTAAQVGLTRAFRAAEASAMIPFDFLRLPFVAGLGFLLYAEILDLWTWIGAAIIFASSYSIARYEALAARAA